MTRMIFINLPVTDLQSSVAFYGALGFTNNPQFSDDTAACMVLSETISVMLLTHEKWGTFTNRPIPPKTSSEVMLCVSCDGKEAVDSMIKSVALHHGIGDVNPIQDLGFMYSRSFADPDGHVWEAMWMDMSGLPGEPT
jgi:uncharacterized protein